MNTENNCNRIPEEFLRDGLALSKCCVVYGVRIPDMTRDELMAVAALGWDTADSIRKTSQREAEDYRSNVAMEYQLKQVEFWRKVMFLSLGTFCVLAILTLLFCC